MSEMNLTVYADAAVMPIMDRQAARVRYQAMVDFVGDILREGTDYGLIPGTGSKPSLLKPGAEKLTTFFGLSKRFEIVDKVEDWTGQDHGGEAFFYYMYRCRLLRGELVIAECDGSANSWESKHRYRKAERVCPNCGQAAIIKGKSEYGGGWLCFAKKGGCGAKFKDGDAAIEAQEVGRVVNPDPADVVNTLQKMAQKRALVGATLLAVNGSDYFTQDVEDYDVEGSYTVTKPVVSKPATGQQPQAEYQPEPGEDVWADWKRPADAQAWAMTQGKFDHQRHMENAYANVKATVTKNTPNATARDMWRIWWEYVTNHEPAKAQAAGDDDGWADVDAHGHDADEPRFS